MNQPSQSAYDNAMRFMESQRVDLHQDWTKGFAYAPQVLVGLPEARIETREDGDLDKQIAVTEKQTVV